MNTPKQYLVDAYRGYEDISEVFTDRDEAYDMRDRLWAENLKARVIPIVTCCVEELICDDFTNVCQVCGRLYNWNGDPLRPRDQWEEPWEEDI